MNALLPYLVSVLDSRLMSWRARPPVELKTSRLRLRSFRVFEDWPRFREYQRDPEVVDQRAEGALSDPELRAVLRAYAGLTRNTSGHRYLRLGIQLANESRLLGEISLVPHRESGPLSGISLFPQTRPCPERAILGYALHRDAWGRGFATEAARALIDHGFRGIGYREIWAGCIPENHRSLRVLEKSGLARTSEKIKLRGAHVPAGLLMFRADAATWPKRG